MKIFKGKKIEMFTMIGYMILSFIIITFHESWRDEAQAWLIARDLSWIGIIKQMKYEGHPFLWHYILAVFAKLKFPYVTIKYISLIIMNIFVWIFLNKSPFNRITKILIILSSPVIYLYPAIARNYCLIPLAIAIISINFKNREEKPIEYILSIIFLANTHVLMFGLVGVLLTEFYIEQILKHKTKVLKNKKLIISFFIAIVLLLIVLIPLVGSTMKNLQISPNMNLKSKSILHQITIIFYRIIQKLFGENRIILIFISIVMIILIYYQIKYFKKNLILLIISIAYILYVFIAIYFSIFEQKAAIFFFIALFFAWRQEENYFISINKIDVFLKRFCIVVLLSFNIINSLSMVKNDITKTYSYARDTANFINNELEGATFISSNIFMSSAIIPYVKDERFWNVKSRNFFTFITYNEDSFPINSLEELKVAIKSSFNVRTNLYLIYSYDWNEQVLKKLEDGSYLSLVYESDTQPIMFDEKYKIYRIEQKFFE